MSSIVDISFIGLLAPLPHGKAYGMSKSLATARQATLVVIKTEAGIEGVGEAFALALVGVDDPAHRDRGVAINGVTVEGAAVGADVPPEVLITHVGPKLRPLLAGL